MKSTFSVIYYLKRQVVKKDGTVPVMGRITVDGSQTQFSCKLTVDPKLWTPKVDVSQAEARRHSKRTVCLTRCGYASIGTIRKSWNVTTSSRREKVKNAFSRTRTPLPHADAGVPPYNEDYEKQVEAGMKAKGTLEKYRIVYKHMQEFLDIRYHVKDIALKEAYTRFHLRLRDVPAHETNTAAPIPCGCTSARYGRWYSSPSTTSG